jgi:hypothetical protein
MSPAARGGMRADITAALLGGGGQSALIYCPGKKRVCIYKLLCHRRFVSSSLGGGGQSALIYCPGDKVFRIFCVIVKLIIRVVVALCFAISTFYSLHLVAFVAHSFIIFVSFATDEQHARRLRQWQRS